VEDASEDLQQLGKDVVLTLAHIRVHRTSLSLCRLKVLDHHAHRRLHHARVVRTLLSEQVHKRLELTPEWESQCLTWWLAVHLVKVISPHAALVCDAAVQLGRHLVVSSVDGLEDVDVRVEVRVEGFLCSVLLAVHAYRMRLIDPRIMSQEFLGARFTSSRCDRPPARRVKIVHARRQRFHLQPIENRGHHGLDKPRNGDTRGLRTGSTQECWKKTYETKVVGADSTEMSNMMWEEVCK
jgi:hypothetical protein